MEWHSTDYPDWQDAGKQIEMGNGVIGELVVVDQTPGEDEAPIWGVRVGGTLTEFDYTQRWRFVAQDVATCSS